MQPPRGTRERVARPRDAQRSWQRAGVRPEAWDGRPHHAFRKGFVSELKRSAADSDAVEFLVGHSLGLRGVDTDPDALPLRDTIEKIPALLIPGEPRFDGLDPNATGPIREIRLGDRPCPLRVPPGTPRRDNVVRLDAFRRRFGGGGNRTSDNLLPK